MYVLCCDQLAGVGSLGIWAVVNKGQLFYVGSPTNVAVVCFLVLELIFGCLCVPSSMGIKECMNLIFRFNAGMRDEIVTCEYRFCRLFLDSEIKVAIAYVLPFAASDIS